jgi:hypothetical protein
MLKHFECSISVLTILFQSQKRRFMLPEIQLQITYAFFQKIGTKVVKIS